MAERTNHMKAVIVDEYGGPEVLEVRETRVPVPGPRQCLVRLYAAGVNPVDAYLRSGSQGFAPALPHAPGMDGAGIVESVGTGFSGPGTGERVYVAGADTGTYAEFCLASAGRVFPLADSLNWVQGASLGVPYFTAARALFTLGRAAAGERILVHGATGGVGTACLQLLAGRGFSVAGTAGSDWGLAMVESAGARAYDHRDPEHFTALAAEGGFDLVVEMAADANLGGDLKLLAPGGRISVVGSRGRVEIAPRDLMTTEGCVRGVRVVQASDEERLEYALLIAEGAASGAVKPLVAADFPLEEAAQAHEAVMKGPHAGNLVIRIRNYGA